MRNVNTLVTIAGHATYLDSVAQVPDDPTDERNWELQSFQQGEVPIFIGHMRRGAELVAADRTRMGLMSGGRTRLAGGQWSEASSYLDTAGHYGFWQETDEASADVFSRFGVERFARDSLENLLFSVIKFRRAVGSLPLHVTAVGWEVKQPRFEHHARTLGIPKGTFEYVAVPLDAYGNTAQPEDMDYFAENEKRTLGLWHDTPLGDSGELLDKRNARNPFNIVPPYDWAEYVGYVRERKWEPCQEVLAAAVIDGAAAA